MHPIPTLPGAQDCTRTLAAIRFVPPEREPHPGTTPGLFQQGREDDLAKSLEPSHIRRWPLLDCVSREADRPTPYGHLHAPDLSEQLLERCHWHLGDDSGDEEEFDEEGFDDEDFWEEGFDGDLGDE